MKVDPTVSRLQSPLLIFFGLAFGFAWMLWIPLALLFAQEKALSFPFTIVSLLASFAPLVAALAITAWQEGRVGPSKLLKQGFRWKTSLVWYGIAIFLPALLILVALGIYIMLGGKVHGFPSLKQWLITPLNFVLVLVIGGPLGEEFGWRGFALPRLQARYGALGASLLLGLVWSVWHLPLFFISGTSQQSIPFGLFLLQTVPLTLLFTWLYNRTHHSVLHTAVNTWRGLFPLLPDRAGSLLPSILLTVLLWLGADFVVLIAGKSRRKDILWTTSKRIPEDCDNNVSD